MNNIINLIQKIGAYITASLRSYTKYIAYIGDFICFIFNLICSITYVFKSRKNISLMLKQMYLLGNHSIIIIMVSGFFVGLVLALQGYYVLNKYGSEQILGLMVGLSLLRELSPVVSGLLYAGRAGTSITAEVGLMKQGEQLTALEIMAVNPLKYILAPRFWAGVICMPLLSILFTIAGIFGAYVIAVLWIGIDVNSFWNNMQSGINFELDVLNGLLKALVFGIIINATALYQGYNTKATPEGVAKSTTNTVILSSLAILFGDFILTAILFVK
jgi:phospholipid/cholesterol/gamma-HCH transport system permease protein